MFKAWLQYVPFGPLILAVLLFVLLPFDDEGQAAEARPAPQENQSIRCI